MSLTWIICGAGRRVGKTTLAFKLCKVLPDSVYAKCGHSRAKAEKPGRFFSNLDELESFVEACRRSYKHIVVESNALAGLGRGDIIIFIDGIAGKIHFRRDTKQLRTSADLKICRAAMLVDWKKALAAKVASKTLRNKVCDCLMTQKRHLFASWPKVRTKVWFEAAGLRVFGNGLAQLMENVNSLGTLQDAAKAANMSYRYAWDLVHTAEEHFGKTLIERHAGGRCGGSSALSTQGQHMLEAFKQLNEEVVVFANRRFSELYNNNKDQDDA